MSAPIRLMLTTDHEGVPSMKRAICVVALLTTLSHQMGFGC